MEGIILLIISLIVGSFFNKKKTSPKEQTKPFTAQDSQNDPVRKLQEMSKKMYQELQQEMQPETEKQPVTPRNPVVSKPAPMEVAVPPREERIEISRETRSAKRQSALNSKKEQRTVRNTQSLLPKSEDDLIKGVIFSEIFGPPKSKR